MVAEINKRETNKQNIKKQHSVCLCFYVVVLCCNNLALTNVLLVLKKEGNAKSVPKTVNDVKLSLKYPSLVCLVTDYFPGGS